MHDSEKPWIILVDDDEDDRFLVQQAFKAHGRKLLLQCLPSGADLFELLDEAVTLPAMVLLDLNMPFMNGFEVLTRLRSHAAYRIVPVIILTSSDSPSDRRQAHELGAQRFITKPTTLEELGGMVVQLDQEWLNNL